LIAYAERSRSDTAQDLVNDLAVHGYAAVKVEPETE
jgi:hypothetical protein